MTRHVPIDLPQSSGACQAVAHARQLGAMPVAEKACSYAGGSSLAVLFNQRAHLNARDGSAAASARAWRAAPQNKLELDRTLAEFARHKIDTIAIDGGDGTVREVLSLAKRHFGDTLPRFVIVPSGKTNALAGDLGIDTRWTVEDMVQTLHRWRTVRRSPIEIRYGSENESRLRGFIFGTGAFVRATALAQTVHKAGAFNGLAVGLSLAGALGQTLFGGDANPWRRGDAVTLELNGCAIQRRFFMLLGSTLERMPLGLRPFGQERGGLKLLGVDGPPRKFVRSAAAMLAGSESQWLNDAGYKRVDAESFRLRMDSDFVLDGETFRGGDLTISKGAAIDFLVPA